MHVYCKQADLPLRYSGRRAIDLNQIWLVICPFYCSDSLSHQPRPDSDLQNPAKQPRVRSCLVQAWDVGEFPELEKHHELDEALFAKPRNVHSALLSRTTRPQRCVGASRCKLFIRPQQVHIHAALPILSPTLQGTGLFTDQARGVVD